jgi:hypothetical protein
VAVGYRLVLAGLALVGLLVGWGTVLALFDYNGTRPVNVVHALVVLVGLQLVLLVLLGIALLPRRFTRVIPGVSLLQEALRWMSPGQVVRALARRLPGPVQDWVSGRLGSGTASGSLPGRVQKWAVVLSGQVFGVGFNLGALATALYLITFSDLAFSWSTTLTPDVERVHCLTGMVSVPWRRWLPEAVPSEELIRGTLFYRQEGLAMDAGGLNRWGGWWPFLIAGLVVYGLAPRLLLVVLAGWRFREAIKLALLNAPGVGEVVDRLTWEAVTTQSPQPEAGENGGASPEVPRGPLSVSLGKRYAVVNWGGIESSDERVRQALSRRWNGEVTDVLHAGGVASLADDSNVVRAIAADSSGAGAVIVVKAWEPPMLECMDFVRDLRRAMRRGRGLMVLLVGMGEGGLWGAPRESDVVQWRRRLGTVTGEEVVVQGWNEEGAR